jgi:thioredoxin-related protein
MNDLKKNWPWLLLIGGVLAVCYAVYTKNDEAQKPSLPDGSKRTVKLLLVTSSPCKPCDALKEAFKDGFGLPCEKLSNSQELTNKWKIEGTPTLIGLDKDGSETDRLLGFDTKEKTQEWLKRLP